jgi:T5SS/PEP-CTERM-associated repeat protein
MTEDWGSQSLVIYNDAISLDLAGKTLTTKNEFRTSIYVGVFENDEGYLHVTHGTLRGNGLGVGGPWLGSAGFVEVSGSDASISLTESVYGELVVGGGGAGHLVASHGSTVIAGSSGVWIGGDPGSGDFGIGTVGLISGSSLTSAGDIYLGPYGGNGHLFVGEGSTISGRYGFIGYAMSDGAPDTAIVSGNGSLWQTTSGLYVGGNAFNPAGSGVLDINNGGQVSSNVTIWLRGTLTGDAGTLVGNVANRGLIAPGDSNGPAAGVLFISGALQSTAPTSRLEFDLAGPSNFDQLEVTGSLTLGGIVDIDLLDGFVPTFGSSFKILSFGNFADSGFTFNFSGAALGGDLTWDTSTFKTDGTLRVVPEPSAITLALLAIFSSQIISLPSFRRRAANFRRLNTLK